ncbi:hypothetical protein SMJ63A_80032 [Stenotrophomonas geniculata]
MRREWRVRCVVLTLKFTCLHQSIDQRPVHLVQWPSDVGEVNGMLGKRGLDRSPGLGCDARV